MLLPKNAARSDTALNVYGCAICHICSTHEPELASAVAAAFHIRLPGSEGARLGILLQQLLASSKFQRDLIAKTRMTVDDASTGTAFSIHCMLAEGLVIISCTKQDYPTRIVFPNSTKPTDRAGKSLGTLYNLLVKHITTASPHPLGSINLLP